MSRKKTKGDRMDFRPTFTNKDLVLKAMEHYNTNRSDAINRLLTLAEAPFFISIIEGEPVPAPIKDIRPDRAKQVKQECITHPIPDSDELN